MALIFRKQVANLLLLISSQVMVILFFRSAFFKYKYKRLHFFSRKLSVLLGLIALGSTAHVLMTLGSTAHLVNITLI